VATQVGTGEPVIAGQRRGGERRLGVCGAAVSSGGGRCSDGEARWWRSARCFDGCLRRAVAQRPAWHAVEAHESRVVGASALGAEECGDKGGEERGKSREEWAAFGGCHGKRRDGFSHGPIARRGVARGDGCMRRAWSGRSAASARSSGSGHVAIARVRHQHRGAG
jgi:hypothetical protein